MGHSTAGPGGNESYKMYDNHIVQTVGECIDTVHATHACSISEK